MHHASFFSEATLIEIGVYLLFRLCLLKVVFRSLYVFSRKGLTRKKESLIFLEPDSTVKTSYLVLRNQLQII